jgi:hypothetical protein
MKHKDIMQDKPVMEKIAKKVVKGHEKRMHGSKKMAKGGVTSEQMKSMGRNLARAANQKTG